MSAANLKALARWFPAQAADLDNAANDREFSTKALRFRMMLREMGLSFEQLVRAVPIDLQPELEYGAPINLQTVERLRDLHLDTIALDQVPFVGDLIGRLKRGTSPTSDDFRRIEHIRAQVRIAKDKAMSSRS